jgi:putative NIF3 family GTP cyclohydrolase 1 type 2
LREVNCPAEVKVEMGNNLILGGHGETEVFGVRALAGIVAIQNRGQ